MPYAVRDESGKLIRLDPHPSEASQEQIDIWKDEVFEYLSGLEDDSLKNVLSMTDSETMRVVDDVLDLLMKEHLITFTELPVEAQNKIRLRHFIRQRLGGDEGIGQILNEEDGII